MDLRKVQILNEVIKYAKVVPFYQDRLPGQIKSYKDFKDIPLTLKEDLQNHSPYGFVAADKEDLLQYHESSGTTGNPISAWFSEKDLDDITTSINDCGVHFSKRDKVLIRFPYALSTISHFLHQAAQKKHACVIPADSRTTVTPMPRVIELMRKLEVTVLACNPLQAIMLADVAEKEGLHPIDDFPSLRAICTAGEPLTPFKRNLLHEIWGVPIYDNYGMTEVGTVMVECQYQQLHPFQAAFHIEILRDDLQTEALPGEAGNLVLTTLQKRATLMIRYLTGDRARVINMKCPCSKEPIVEILGRKSNLIKLNQIDFDQMEIEEVIYNLPCRRFWAVGVFKNTLTFFVEKESESDQVPAGMEEAFQKQYEVKMKIHLVEKGTLYDRNEIQSFGVKAKPRYLLTEEEISKLLIQIF
jgi:phenylacetate-CoA ligase